MRMNLKARNRADRVARSVRRRVYRNLVVIARSRGYSLSSFAVTLGLYPNDLYAIRRQNVTVGKLARLAELVGVPLEDLMFRDLKPGKGGNDEDHEEVEPEQ